ncbi:MAG: hypothetical protein ISR65_01025 [Bacteriovoracaceae bacterium]|nr:hypothetical protein [Bacteriovoracaceae bacterium]
MKNMHLIFSIICLTLFINCRQDQSELSMSALSNSTFSLIDTVKITRGSFIRNKTYSNSPLRYVSTQLRICMTDPVSGRPIPYYNFGVALHLIEHKPALNINQEVELDNNYFTKKMTNASGCFNVDKTIEYNQTTYSDWSTYKIVMQDMDKGVYGDIKSERLVYINPHLRTNDFGIDSKDKDPPVAFKVNPQIHIKEVTVTPAGDDRDSYKINNYLHLYLERKFDIDFTATVQLDHNFEGEKPNELLLSGNYRLKALVLTPINEKVRFSDEVVRNINGSDYKVISSTEAIHQNKFEKVLKPIKVQNGSAYVSLSLPLFFKDLPQMAKNNILLLEFSPYDLIKAQHDSRLSQLRPAVVTIPFTYNGQKDVIKKNARNLFREVSHKELASISQQISNTVEQNKKTIVINNPTDSYDLFEKDFLKKHPLRNINLKSSLIFTQSEFNRKWKKVEEDRWDYLKHNLDKALFELIRNRISYPFNTKYKNHLKPISDAEMDNLVHDKADITTLRKLCKLLTEDIPPPLSDSSNPHQNWIATLYSNCLSSPSEYFTTTPTKHIINIKPYKIKKRYNAGSVNVGKTYFITKNDSLIEETGDRITVGINPFSASTRRNLIPSLLKYIKPNAIVNAVDMGVYSRFDSYEVIAVQESLIETDRNYRQTSIEYAYQEHRFSFKARTRSCVHIQGISSKYSFKAYQMCKYYDEYEVLEESWFYLSTKNPEDPEDNHARAIRGRDNFLALENLHDNKSRVQILEQVNTIGLKGRFKEYLARGYNEDDLLDRGDGSFPGMILPFAKADRIEHNNNKLLRGYDTLIMDRL